MSLEGQQLGQYHLLRLIGSGGMGEVYLAEDARIGQQVAIKVCKSEARSYPGVETASEGERLFQREARAIAQLDHPHILPLFTYGEEQQPGITLTYIVMPYRKEGSLTQWIDQYSRGQLLPPSVVAYLITQAASALQYAHNRGIVHQDVKPSNFLIRSGESEHSLYPDVLLADFGIAKMSTATSSMSNTVRGTATYMAPEQWSGHPVAGSDQYALAIMAYALLTGRPPFHGGQEQMMYMHFSRQPEPPSALNYRLDPEIDTALLRALAKRPEERFPSIAAFAQSLQQAIASANAPTFIKEPQNNAPLTSQSNQPINKTIAVLPAPTIAVRPFPTRHRQSPSGRVILLTALALLVVLASVGFGIYYFRQPNTRASTTLTSAEIIGTTRARDAASFASTSTAQTNSANAQAIQQAANAHETAVAQGTNTAQANATATATFITATTNPYPPGVGTLVFHDPLRDNSLGNNWDTIPTIYGTCVFTEGAYLVSSPTSPFFHSCAAEYTQFDNFAYEIKLTILAGNCGAILFRGDFVNHHYYFFRICQNGTFQLLLYTQKGSATTTFIQDSSSAIRQGLGQTNVIAAVANGNSIALYINHQFINSIQDGTYSQGQIGVAADNDTSSTQVLFSNARVWTLP